MPLLAAENDLSAWLASHTTSEPNALVGWIFLGVVLTGIWLFASSQDTRTTVWTAAGGWVVGAILLTVF